MLESRKIVKNQKKKKKIERIDEEIESINPIQKV
jgi:hypothetical protein